MSRVASFRPPFQKAPKLTSSEKRAGQLYMRRVKRLPCVICGRSGPSDVHHVIHGRFSTARAGDFDTIPLCVEHHRHPYPDAIHSGKASWEEKHGPDFGYIPLVRAALNDAELDF